MKKIITIACSIGLAFSLASATDVFAKPAKKAKEESRSESPKAAASHGGGGGSFSRNYGTAGCGLGSMLIDKHHMQIFAATTNGIGASQLFGITSGTSNCSDSATHDTAKRMDNFLMANKVALASDMARGSGEALTTLSAIVGCENNAYFGESMQRNFGTIFPSEKAQVIEVTDSIISVIRNDSRLAATCNKVTG